MVVQNMAISVPRGMATVGFWEGEEEHTNTYDNQDFCVCMCRNRRVFEANRQNNTCIL